MNELKAQKELSNFVLYRIIGSPKSLDDFKIDISKNGYLCKNYDEQVLCKSKKDLIERYDEMISPSMKERVEDYSSVNSTWAFGDETSAYNFASTHLRFSKNIYMIKFETDLKNIAIDSRDGLSNVMQYFDGSRQVFLDLLSEVYSKKIVEYVDKASKSTNKIYRLSLCDKFVLDDRSIIHHYKNTKYISGRLEMFFRSSFLIIDSKNVKILDVSPIDSSRLASSNDIIDSFDIMSFRK